MIAEFVQNNGPIPGANGTSVREANEAWNKVSPYFKENDSDGMVEVTVVSNGSTKKYYYDKANEQAILSAAGLNASIFETNQKIDEMTGHLNIEADTVGGSK